MAQCHRTHAHHSITLILVTLARCQHLNMVAALRCKPHPRAMTPCQQTHAHNIMLLVLVAVVQCKCFEHAVGTAIRSTAVSDSTMPHMLSKFELHQAGKHQDDLAMSTSIKLLPRRTHVHRGAAQRTTPASDNTMPTYTCTAQHHLDAVCFGVTPML